MKLCVIWILQNVLQLHKDITETLVADSQTQKKSQYISIDIYIKNRLDYSSSIWSTRTAVQLIQNSFPVCFDLLPLN